jgi:hypothetical protein
MATAQILNSQLLTGTNRQPIGGFRHWSGLWTPGSRSGNVQSATIMDFNVPAGNASAIFRGDIVGILGTGGSDQYFNNYAFGGAPVGNPAITANVGLISPGDTTSIFVGVVVGFELTLQMAKLGFPAIPASSTTNTTVHVETDPLVVMAITAGGTTLPTNGWAASIGAGVDLLARNTTYQSLSFGISGSSIDPTTVGNTATLPLRILGSEAGISNDVTDAPVTSGASTVGNPVIRVGFNQTRHMFGTAAMQTPT